METNEPKFTISFEKLQIELAKLDGWTGIEIVDWDNHGTKSYYFKGNHPKYGDGMGIPYYSRSFEGLNSICGKFNAKLIERYMEYLLRYIPEVEKLKSPDIDNKQHEFLMSIIFQKMHFYPLEQRAIAILYAHDILKDVSVIDEEKTND